MKFLFWETRNRQMRLQEFSTQNRLDLGKHGEAWFLHDLSFVMS